MKRNTFPALPYASAVLVVLAAGILAQSTSAGAQEKYPSKAITIVVPYPPGGSNDIFARAIGKRLGAAANERAFSARGCRTGNDFAIAVCLADRRRYRALSADRQASNDYGRVNKQIGNG